MRILMAAMSMGIGGAETHILELCSELCRRGHDVTVVSSGGVRVGELTAAGCKHVTAPLDKREARLICAARRTVARLIRDEKYDIVHAHARIPAFVCGKICRKYGVPFVTTAHYNFTVTPVLRRLTDWGEHSLAVSEDIAAYLRDFYAVDGGRITVIPNGIDTDKFSHDETGRARARSALGIGDEYVILHVSRIDDASSLTAFALLSSDIPSDERLVIVGGGTRIDELRSAAEKVNERLSREAVTVVGAVCDVVPYYRAADVFIGPSRAALEAMACGVPTVISGSQGHIGILSSATEKTALATNLCCRGGDVADDKKLSAEIGEIRKMSDADREKLISYQIGFVKENYSVAAMCDGCEKAYESVLSVRPAAVICGYYGYGNIGDEAMLASIIGGIRREKPEARLYVMSRHADKTSCRRGVFGIGRYDFFTVARMLKKSRLLIFGGGNLLQTETSRRSLMYYLFILHLAKRCGARVAVFSNGIGPIDGRAQKKVARALADADYISLRDQQSARVCGLTSAHISADCTFAYREPIASEKENKLIIAVRRCPDRRAVKIARDCRTVAEKHGLSISVVPMHLGEDVRTARRIASVCGGTVESAQTFDGVRRIFATGRIVIGDRLHALIAACTVGVPCLCIGNSEKTVAFMRSVSMGDCICPTDEIVKKVDRALQNPSLTVETLISVSHRNAAVAEADLNRLADMI